MRKFHVRWWQTEQFLYDRQHQKNEEWRIRKGFEELVTAYLNDSITRSIEEFERRLLFGQPVQGVAPPILCDPTKEFRIPYEMKPGGDFVDYQPEAAKKPS